MLKSVNKEQNGEYLYIFEGKKLLIGRATQHSNADFKLYNDFVSRQHCTIYMNNGELFIEDLNSKHGTEVNHNKLDPWTPYKVKQGDIIHLVNGLIEFQVSIDNEVTREFTLPHLTNSTTLVLNDALQTVTLEKKTIKMPTKEYACFKLLYKNIGNLISKEDITHFVWQERVGDPDHIVADEEISSLIYRVRKKVNCTYTIKSVIHRGYYMEKKTEKL